MRLFILVFFFPCIVKGQPTGYHRGFVVTNTNDTLHGLVKNIEEFSLKILTKIKFKTDEQAKAEVYPPDSLKEFNIANVKYVTRYLYSLKKNFFFKVVIDDYLTLYELQFQYYGVNNFQYYYILQRRDEKVEESLTVLPFITYPFKKNLTKYLKDDPELCTKIRTRYYYEGEVIPIVEAYNKFIADKKSKE